MIDSQIHFSPSEAASRLGVSAKALRLYEQRGLLEPLRTAAGWRTYGPDQMARAAEIAALRSLGLSLAGVGQVLEGEPNLLEPALAAHQTSLEGQVRHLSDTIEKLRGLRADLANGAGLAPGEIARTIQPKPGPCVDLVLPWPWAGERWVLPDLRPLTYIVGPLFSGKTRLARAIAANLPEASYLDLDRLKDDSAAAIQQLEADPNLKVNIDRATTWLTGEGGTASPALTMLLAAMESETWGVLVVDMVEAGLDRPTQAALASRLRLRGPEARPLILLTRSNLILDLDAVGANETIILCPANHSPPTQVAPYPGAPGYEAVATCLATPEVRARTEGVIAVRPEVA